MKHNWVLDEDGEPDEWAWESGYHNGVWCKDCGLTLCVHCHPDWNERDDCTGWRMKKPKTNADRIRAMSDEKLVDTFGNSLCALIQHGFRDHCEKQAVCDGCVLEWLKQPAKEDE